MPCRGCSGPTGGILERAVARVCREGGARVATNVSLRDMNIHVPLADFGRVEVLANGLSLWQGAQAAVDTTFASPVSRDGLPRAGADRVPGKAAADEGRRKRQSTYPELVTARRLERDNNNIILTERCSDCAVHAVHVVQPPIATSSPEPSCTHGYRGPPPVVATRPGATILQQAGMPYFPKLAAG